MPSFSRQRIIFAAVVVEALAAGAFMIEGCGGDDNVDAGPDTGPDVTADVTKDVGPDIIVQDGGKDADASDANVGLAFAMQEATAICTNWFKCCPPPTSNYDLNACVAGVSGYGWEGNLSSNAVVYGRGNVNFDPDAGAACLAAINQFTCTQTSTYWASVTTACQHVFSGKIAGGSGGCLSSFECAPNNFCDPTVDGGFCTSVHTNGQPCNDKLTGYNVANQECSYLGSTQSGLFCDIVNNGAGGYGAPATCKPTLVNGANCVNTTTFDYTDLGCTSLLCGDDSKCGDTATYPVIAGTCSFYKIKDAGGGG
nr:hypothetical protein Hi04_10k_c3883_00004 [uncultured bacterium]